MYYEFEKVVSCWAESSTESLWGNETQNQFDRLYVMLWYIMISSDF